MIAEAKSSQLTYVVNHIKRLDGVKESSDGIGCPTCHTMGGFENNGREFGDMATAVREQIARLRSAIPDANGRKSLETIERAVSAWEPLYQEFLRDIQRNDFEQAHAVIRDKMNRILDDVDKAAKSLAEGQRDVMIAAGKDATATVE